MALWRNILPFCPPNLLTAQQEYQLGPTSAAIKSRHCCPGVASQESSRISIVVIISCLLPDENMIVVQPLSSKLRS